MTLQYKSQMKSWFRGPGQKQLPKPPTPLKSASIGQMFWLFFELELSYRSYIMLVTPTMSVMSV